ncbi:MAG TPA: 50S ribosomal protein L4, partial [Gammaproteobacteria bacterium]|nr:50S ribosomal protein L4 [Gammaproteobacteria bacterium]
LKIRQMDSGGYFISSLSQLELLKRSSLKKRANQRTKVYADYRLNCLNTQAEIQLSELGLDNVLIVTDDADDNLYLAARNLPNVAVCEVASADPVSLMGVDKVLMTKAAIEKIEERLA